MTKNAREKSVKKQEEVEIIKRNAQDLNATGIIIERNKKRQGKQKQRKNQRDQLRIRKKKTRKPKKKKKKKEKPESTRRRSPTIRKKLTRK